MAVAVGPRDAVVLSAVFGLCSNGAVAVRHRRDVDGPIVRRLVSGSLLGMPLGVLVLITVPVTPLRIAISVVVLVSVVALARGWEFVDPHPATDLGAGFVSGVLNTSVGVSGPPIVADLHGRRLAKGPFRASAVAHFTLTGVVALALFVVAGRLDVALVLAAAIALPAWPAGALVGGWLHRRFPEDRFRDLVLVLLVLTALVTLVAALASAAGDP